MRSLLLTALLFLSAAPAQAATLVSPDGGPVAAKYERWQQTMRAPAPPGRVVVHEGDCPAYPAGAVAGCAYTQSGEVFLSHGTGRYEFRHELGHIFDARNLDDAARERFRLLMGDPRGAWFDPALEHDARPGERFADLYATCAAQDFRQRRYAHQRFWISTLDWTPWTRQMVRLCDAFDSYGARMVQSSFTGNWNRR